VSKLYNCLFWWITPVRVGWLLTALVVGVFSFLAVQRICILLPSGTLECRKNIFWFLNSSPNEIGDTLAGFAGTLAFVWIIVTVAIQSKELSQQRKQIKKQTREFKDTNAALAAQRFDQAFFGILSTYNQILSDIDLDRGTNVTKGRDCFTAFSKRLRNSFNSLDLSVGPIDPENVKQAYDKFWNENQSNLGHYFRFLYNAFRFIDQSSNKEDYHGRLLRSQLSDQELLLLFYNCLSRQGEKFLIYAERFALFDNLPHAELFRESDALLVSDSAWGTNKPSRATP
jgi:hypothetical protein